MIHKRSAIAVVKEVWFMQITRTKKALAAVIALVLIGVFAAVAAVCLPGSGSSLPFKDNTVADSGSGADAVSTVSASSTAPFEDGTVPGGYQPDGTGIADISTARGDLDGEFYLTDNITIDSLDTSGNTFSGTLDGNGKTITINATASGGLIAGGLFSKLSGTVKNAKIAVQLFSFNTGSAGQRDVGIIAGVLNGGTVDNVKITLSYSPTGNDPSQGIGNVAAYFYDNGQHSGQSLDTFFGGVAGSSIGGTIKNTTVHNATSGDYGVSIVTANKKPTFGSASSDNAMGLFFGCATGGTTYLTNIRVVENSDSKISSNFYQASHDKRSLIGVIWGWGWSESIVNIDGIIYDNTIDFKRYTNYAGNESIGTKHAGSMNGWHEGGVSVKNIFAPAEMTWLDGTDDTIRGTIYTEDKVVAFDDNNTDNIIVKAAFANPTADTVTSTITVGNSTTSVLQALTVGDGETAGGAAAYVSVKKSTENLNGTNYNISYGNANKGTMNLGGASFTENRTEGYYSSREYDGNAETARSISLSTGKTIDNVYVDNSGLGKNVGLHTLAFNADALGSDYKLVSYAGVNYIVGDGYVYTPDNIQINGEQSVIDVAKNQIAEITQRAITVGNTSGNIVYGDTLDTVQANNKPAATVGSIVENEYIESCTISDYVQFETSAGDEEAFAYTAVVIKDADGADVTANYNITYGEGKAVVKQKTIAGTLSVSVLVYDTTAKTAEFSLTDGALYNGDAVSISYSGEQTDVTADGFTATATVPNGNYTFGGDNGSSISQNFKITPYEITITAKADRPASHVYNSGIVSADDLFDIPAGLGDDGALALSLSATKDGEVASIELVGEYKVTASLAAGQDNYTAEPVTVDYEVTPYMIEIGINEETEKSKAYDGAALTESEMQGLFVAPQQVEGAETALTVSVEGGVSVLNEGTYKITATILDEDLDLTRYALKEDVLVEFTIDQVVIDGEINAPEDSVYDGSEKFATFVFAEGSAMVGNDEVILTYATKGDQSVAQVVSAGTYTVSAALPEYAEGKSNYKWASSEIATKDIVIEQAPVTIQKAEDANEDYSGVAFTDYASLFTAPNGVNNEGALTLSYSVVKDEEAVEGGIVDAGTYTVTATLADNGTNANYKAEDAVVTYTVSPVTVQITWSENDYTYTGEVQTVGATYLDVNDSPVELAVSFGDGVEFMNAGGYTATASFAEGDNADGNYALPEVATNTYNIKKADSVIDVSEVATEYTYTGSLQTVTGATLNHGEAELTYDNNTFTTVAEGNGMQVVISVADTANYKGTSTTVQITVNKATPAVTATVEPTEGLFTSDEMPAISTECAVDGTIAWDADQSLTAGVNDYSWTFTPDDTDNYNVVKGSETLTVAAVEFTGIEVTTLPSEVNYEYGDKFDKTGMVVEAVYNDGSRVTVEEYTFADEYLTVLGENQIEIAYDGKTATVAVNVEAKTFEMVYSDLTVVAGTPDFDIASITASIAGTENGKVTVAGVEYDYSVTVAYTAADNVYDSEAAAGATYALTATLSITGLDEKNYQSAYSAVLTVISEPIEGSWTSGAVTADYDGNAHAAVFTADNGLTAGVDFEIQYALKGTDVWTTDAPVNAGEYVAKVVSLNDGYSADRLTTATVTINKASVTISAGGVENGSYTGSAVDPSTLFNIPQGVGDEGALTLEYTITKDDVPVDEIKNAGSYKVVATLANADGNYTAEACEVTYVVSPAEVSGNWVGESSVVFSGEAYEPAFEATLVGGEKISVTYQATDGTLTDGKARNAGSYTATAALPNDNYTFASGVQQSFAFEIKTAKITVTYVGSNVNVEYGTAYAWNIEDFYKDPAVDSGNFTVEFGFESSDALTDIATADKGTVYNANLSITVKYVSGGAVIDESDMGNFEVVNGEEYSMQLTVTIVTKKIDVTATDDSATYDGEKVSVDKLLAMFSVDDGAAVSVNVNNTPYDQAEIAAVGVYTVVIASANDNYEFVGDTDALFTVDAADMTAVTVTGYGGEYDKAAHGAVVNASAVTVDGSEVTFTYAQSEEGEYSATAPSYTNAGVYTVWYKASAANHNEESGSFTVTISKAVVDLPAIASKVYNGETQTAAVAESDLYKVTANVGGVNAGGYNVVIQLTDGDNYEWASDDEDKDGVVTLTFTITKADNEWLTQPAIEGWTYGETAGDPAGAAKFGKVKFAYQTAEGETLDQKPVDAGSYKLVATVDGNDNYAGLEKAVGFTIEKADYDMSGVTFENKTVTYNGEVQALTVTGTLPDNVTVTYSSNGIENAGSVTITATFATSDTNYNAPEAMTATLTVAPRQLTFTGYKAVDREYNGDTAITLTGGTLKDILSGDEVSYTYSAEMNTANAGENTVTVKITLTGKDAGNYTVATPATTNVTIAKATYDMSDVKFEDKSATYNGAAQSITINGTLPAGVNVSYSGEGVNVGVYTVTATFTGDFDNYNAISDMTAKLTINAKTVTVVWGALSFEFDGEAKLPTATVDTGIDGETLTLTVSADKEAVEPGSYTATATTDNANYALENATVGFSIVKTAIVAQFTVENYGEISVSVESDEEIEYSVDGGAWTALPADGKITVTPAASWTVSLRFKGETNSVSHVVYTSAGNVVTYLESNLSDNALDNKAVIDAAKAWLKTAVGDKSEAAAKIEAAEQAYETAKDELAESVGNAFKAAANMTSRAVAATVAIATAVTGLGLAVGALALRRKGGNKNEK